MHDFVTIAILKRSCAKKELICENADAPDVYGPIILFPLQNLWRGIIQSSTKCFSSRLDKSWPSEIAKLSHSSIKDYIFRFYISMSNASSMKISKSLNNISKKLNGLFDTQSSYLIEILKQSSSTHIFEDKIKMLFFLEKAIKLNYFGMIERIMKFNFFDKLMDHIKF